MTKNNHISVSKVIRVMRFIRDIGLFRLLSDRQTTHNPMHTSGYDKSEMRDDLPIITLTLCAAVHDT